MTMEMHRHMVEKLEGAAGLEMEDSFRFGCDGRCMGRCCNGIKIMLDPWDVEAMARHLGMSGRDFIDGFCSLEEEPATCWPYVKLKDVEHGPCAFLLEDGKCRVYPARPRNCRTYPVGRAVRFIPGGGVEEKFFLVEKQNFCLGHSSGRLWTLREWLEDAGAQEYYRRSDLYFGLIHHATGVFHIKRWMNSRTAMMIMPFLYGPEVLRAKMGIDPEGVGHGDFYSRRMEALKVLLAEMAAGFGFGPLVRGDGGEEVEDVSVMERVRGILLTGRKDL